MDISGIISVTGMSGLHKVVAKIKNGLIVEGLTDKKRIPVYASQKISALEDIAIFGKTEDMPLKVVFKKIFEKTNGGAAIDHASNPEELKKYFAETVPEYDADRVYVSDIKKVFLWYNMLQGLNLLKLEEEKKEETATDGTAIEPETANQKPQTFNKPAVKFKEHTPKTSKAKVGGKGTVRKTGVA